MFRRRADAGRRVPQSARYLRARGGRTQHAAEPLAQERPPAPLEASRVSAHCRCRRNRCRCSRHCRDRRRRRRGRRSYGPYSNDSVGRRSGGHGARFPRSHRCFQDRSSHPEWDSHPRDCLRRAWCHHRCRSHHPDLGSGSVSYATITEGYIMRYGALAVYAVDLPPDVLIEWFAHVPTDQYRTEMQRWAASQEPRRQRARYRRAPEAFLTRLEQLWQTSAPSKPL